MGLNLFVARSEIPMDNNVAERDMRTPVVGQPGRRYVQRGANVQTLGDQFAHLVGRVFSRPCKTPEPSIELHNFV